MIDGKIVSIKCDYNFDNQSEEIYASFIYYNIGLSEVVIPENVIENVVE